MRHGSNASPTPPLAPRFWPAWIGLGVLYVLGRLPAGMKRALGNGFGWIFRKLMVSRMKIARTNLELCFPELSSAQLETMLHRNARSMGAMILELPTAWWSAGDQLLSKCEVRGLEHLEAARTGNRGVLLLGLHFTTMDMAGRMLGLHVDRAAGLYRPHKNTAVEFALHRARTRDLDCIIPRRDVRGAIEYLRGGGVLWYAPDQDYKGVDTEFVSFFGIPTSTITSTQKLARAGRAKVIPYWLERLDGSRGFVMHFGAALQDFPSGNRIEDTQRVSDTIEAAVREWPDHYLWVHQRFKTRPKGQPSPY